MECRICKGETAEVIDFGNIYPSAFLKDNEVPNRKYPLTLVECVNCGLVQLTENPPLDDMYREYWYRSGTNSSMIKDLGDVVQSTHQHVKLQPMDLIIDIGCNDGALFEFYPKDIITVGYDPALNLKPDCDMFINDYFPTEDKLPKKAKVITSIAMFYDLPDPHIFIEGIKKHLAKDGIWIIQFTDLASMYSVTAFDNICHEHLEYYTLKDLVNLMSSHGLQIFDVSYNKVNGGSIRAVICWKGAQTINPNIDFFLLTEGVLLDDDWVEEFKISIAESKDKVLEYLKKARTVALLGASTKGNTLLQVWKIDSKMVDHAAEVNPDKFGLRTVGTDIPIISQEESLTFSPDLYLVLPWHFKRFFLNKAIFIKYLAEGGTLLFPLPIPHIVVMDNGKLKEKIL